MKKNHKLISIFTFATVTFIAYLFSLRIDTTASQNLVTFFSVAFGFYMTCLAIIYNTSFTKKLYQELDDTNPNRRKIHTLKKYFATSCYWAIFTIITIIIVSAFLTNLESNGYLLLLEIPLTNQVLDLNLLINSCLSGITAVNIFFMILFLNTILAGMVEEAKQ